MELSVPPHNMFSLLSNFHFLLPHNFLNFPTRKTLFQNLYTSFDSPPSPCLHTSYFSILTFYSLYFLYFSSTTPSFTYFFTHYLHFSLLFPLHPISSSFLVLFIFSGINFICNSFMLEICYFYFRNYLKN